MIRLRAMPAGRQELRKKEITGPEAEITACRL